MSDMPEPSRKRKIYEQNQNKQVSIEGLEITGNLGAGVVIHSSQSDMTVINVAGGAMSGDAYQIISRGEHARIEEIDKMIDEIKSDAETHQHLSEAINELRDQIKEGENADMAMVNYLLNWIGEFSPALLDVVAKWIIESPDSGEEAKMLAQVSRRQAKK